MQLSRTSEKFILHWGEMGTRWGTNRTVSQIHALLYLSPQPLPADDIARLLSVARSNVSTSLKELQNYGVVRTTHMMGDRRDHFQATTDMWEMFIQIIAERKKREIDPTLSLLRQCVLEAENDPEIDAISKDRMKNILNFTEELTTWYSQIITVPKSKLIKLMQLGAKVAKFVAKKKNKTL
jgi:DNA-binding transcriptional regulator GbsR (MarR family)